MIAREKIQTSIVKGLNQFPGVALLGPRQCGKTTLARQIANEQGARIFDLENPDGLEVFATDYDFELDNLDDGHYCDVEYPDDMSEEEQERMDELWDEDSYSAWEEEGWSNDDTETWFHGPLSLEQQ